jgi:hypothetical protein
MVQRVSVRRAQIEEQRARKQVVIAGVVAVVFGGIFLFVIFPLMLRAVIFIAQRSSPIAQDEKKLPPQAPVIAAPDQYNSTGTLALSGFTKADTKVTLVVNEQERESTTSDGEGAFEMSVNLDDGEYELYLFATGEDKNTSPDSARYKVVVDRSKPSLTISQPDEGQTFTLRREQNITIKGNLSEAGFVTVNSSKVRTNAEGEFQTQFQLGEGDNTITFVGEDLAGNQSASQTRNVKYTP